jgi:hypothetical protein
MPVTLIEVIFKRKYMRGMEVPNIILLPLVNDFIIDNNFRKDIELVQSMPPLQNCHLELNINTQV